MTHLFSNIFHLQLAEFIDAEPVGAGTMDKKGQLCSDYVCVQMHFQGELLD
jgi:hypothetical protein